MTDPAPTALPPPSSSPPPRRLDWRFLCAHPAHAIALGFGSGLSPWAPGTMGTLLAWALYPLIRTPLSEFVFLALLASLFVAGVLVGADSMSRAVGVPTYLADVIVAVALLAVLVAGLFTQYRIKR